MSIKSGILDNILLDWFSLPFVQVFESYCWMKDCCDCCCCFDCFADSPDSSASQQFLPADGQRLPDKKQ